MTRIDFCSGIDALWPFESTPPKRLLACPHAGALIHAIKAALAAVDPMAAITRHVAIRDHALMMGNTEISLRKTRQIRVLGGGKGALLMAEGLNSILSEEIESGCIVVKATGDDATHAPVGNIRVAAARHPVPDAAGVAVAREMLALARELREKDLAIVLISGGASALLTLPAEPLTLADMQETTTRLLNAGADIQSLNTVRKHLSAIKGGRLMEAIFPARAVTLLLSDVVGDPIDIIGSGPTAPDPGTFEEAFQVLDRFNLLEQAPPRVIERLAAGMAGDVPETPKTTDPIFGKAVHQLIGANQMAADAAVAALNASGIDAARFEQHLTGEARDAAARVCRAAKDLPSLPSALVFGGETTVTVAGEGKGGRNQELALAAALHLQHQPRTLVLTLGTDGGDGPTDAAGAVAVPETVPSASAMGLSAKAHLDPNQCGGLDHPAQVVIPMLWADIQCFRIFLVSWGRHNDISLKD
jgi:glycerate 2-kinase